jgi:titin
VISGNDVGVLIDGSNAPTDNNVVAGNYIGTDVTGTAAIGNFSDGVDLVNGASNNVIGGTAPGAGNLLSGNKLNGVGIFNASNANTVEGNLIGTDVTGAKALDNRGDGVLISGSANNVIGGTASGAANTIAHNRQDGVLVTGAGAVGNSIRGNSIYKNHGLGIDLTNGGNNAQSAPQLTSAVTLAGGTIQVQGTLTSLPNITYTLDFYGSSSGGAQTYLGSATVTTDASGNATFTVVFTVPTSPGEVVTATATDPEGDTSEFSNEVHIH